MLLAIHFMERACVIEILRFFVLYKFKAHPFNITDITKVLLCLKAYWILRMNSLVPQGLNQSLDFCYGLFCFGLNTVVGSQGHIERDSPFRKASVNFARVIVTFRLGG